MCMYASIMVFVSRPTEHRLTLWCCDVCVIQGVDDPWVILAKGQVSYQMGHVDLQKEERSRERLRSRSSITVHFPRLKRRHSRCPSQNSAGRVLQPK